MLGVAGISQGYIPQGGVASAYGGMVDFPSISVLVVKYGDPDGE